MAKIGLSLMAIGAAMSAAFILACSSDSVAPEIPELVEIDPALVVFLSDLNSENGGQGAVNWTEFEDWVVTDGCVDLHGNGFIDVWPNNGLYIDLDGTCSAGGTIEMKEELAFEPGDYVLEFWLAGNNRINRPDTVLVRLGAMHEEEIIMQRRDPFRHFEREFSVVEETTAKLSFQNYGGDDRGALLDLVRVRRIP
jgi:hypothetical protein